MKAIGIVLLLLAGLLTAGGFAVLGRTMPSVAAYVGAFAIPAIVAWSGVILINKASNKKDGRQS